MHLGDEHAGDQLRGAGLGLAGPGYERDVRVRDPRLAEDRLNVSAKVVRRPAIAAASDGREKSSGTITRAAPPSAATKR